MLLQLYKYFGGWIIWNLEDQSGLWSIWGQAGRHALPYHKWTCIETDGRSIMDGKVWLYITQLLRYKRQAYWLL